MLVRPPLVRKDGYRTIWDPDHPNSHDGRVYEHRVVAEQKIGRFLRTDEIVHHINGNRSDNRPENLEVVTKHQHQVHHLATRPDVSDEDILELLEEGWTYRDLAAIGIWQHRVSRAKKSRAV